MNRLSKSRDRFLKTVSILTSAATVLTMSGLVYLAPLAASAAKPSDYGLKEGNMISAAGSDDPDVYIVNDWGYKRLFLNPVIFNFYGQLTGGFAAVKNVSTSVRDAFPTSGLFRDCQAGSSYNDGKVYGVEVTGEDTGVLHWVNTSGSQAVADDPNFFKKVFCINDNELNWYSKGSAYTSVSQVPSYARTPGQTPSTPGSVNVSLASDNPGAATLTTKANGVTYLKVNLSGTGTLSSLRVVRRGPGATGDFSNVYLYDGARRLTSGRTPSSSDGSVTFSSLNLAISGTKTLSVVADMSTSGATAGDVNYFTVESASDVVLTSGTVGGSFPVNGSNFTVSGQTGGTITIDKSGSLTNPNVGQANAEVAEFKLTANTEGAKISRIQMIQGGNIANSALTNFKLVVSGTTIATTSGMTSNGYVVFDMTSNPYFIAKGDNRIFQVYADVAGKKADTVDLYIEVTSDILAVGDQFGFGMTVANGTYTIGSSSTGPTTLTLQGGVLTLSFVGPSAQNVGTTTTKTHLLDFNLSAASNLDIRKTSIILCNDYTGTGTFVSAAGTSLSSGFADLNNVEIIDRDTGVAYVGPQDGSAFTTASSDSTIGGGANACGTSVDGYSKLFTDSFSMTAGETKHLAIVADIRQSNTGNYIKSGTIFKALLGSWSTLVGATGDLTVLKYSDTNTGPYNTDIVPSGNLGGNSMTVQGAALTVALAANPASGNRNFVKGTSNVNVSGISFTAAQGNPVTISSLTLQGYAGADNTATATTGNPGALISAIRIVDGDTGAVISSTPSSNNLSLTSGAGSGQIKFSNLNLVIPGGATKTVVAQVDLSTNTVPTNDTLSFDLLATTDVTAVDSSSNTVNASNSLVNVTSGTTSTTYITVTNTGSMAVTAAPNTPISAPVYWGQNSAPFSKFKFTATNEGFAIETLNLVGSNATNLTKNLNNVTISYTNKAGNTLTSTATFNSAGSVSFGFSGDSRPYVPKDGSMTISATANIKPASDLNRADTNVAIQFSGTTADEFRAVGDSGAVITGASTGMASVTTSSTTKVNAQYIYRAYPTFTLVSTPASNLFAGQDIARFTVTANGNSADGSSVFFDGTTAAASGSLAFAVTASGDSTSSLTLELRRLDNNQLLSTASALSNSAGTAASASFTINQNGGLNLTAGQSVDLVVRIAAISGFAKPSSTGRAADYAQATMKTNIDGLQTWTDNSGTDRDADVSSTANILPTLPMTFGLVQLH